MTLNDVSQDLAVHNVIYFYVTLNDTNNILNDIQDTDLEIL